MSIVEPVLDIAKLDKVSIPSFTSMVHATDSKSIQELALEFCMR